MSLILVHESMQAASMKIFPSYLALSPKYSILHCSFPEMLATAEFYIQILDSLTTLSRFAHFRSTQYHILIRPCHHSHSCSHIFRDRNSEMRSSKASSSRSRVPSGPGVVPWGPQDEHYADIFTLGESGTLPMCKEELLETLGQYDELLVAFDEHIGHSSEGFQTFRSRHQKAMEDGLQDIPPYGKFCEDENARPIKWIDQKWAGRYWYAINARKHMVAQRLQQVFGLPKSTAEHFFGERFEPHRVEWNYGKKKPQAHKMPIDWWRPIDEILARYAKTAAEAEAIKLRFWGPRYYISGQVKMEEQDENKPEKKPEKSSENKPPVMERLNVSGGGEGSGLHSYGRHSIQLRNRDWIMTMEERYKHS